MARMFYRIIRCEFGDPKEPVIYLGEFDTKEHEHPVMSAMNKVFGNPRTSAEKGLLPFAGDALDFWHSDLQDLGDDADEVYWPLNALIAYEIKISDGPVESPPATIVTIVNPAADCLRKEIENWMGKCLEGGADVHDIVGRARAEMDVAIHEFRLAADVNYASDFEKGWVY